MFGIVFQNLFTAITAVPIPSGHPQNKRLIDFDNFRFAPTCRYRDILTAIREFWALFCQVCGVRIGRMGKLGKMGSYLRTLMGKPPEGAQKSVPDQYELTYAECADFLLERLHSKEPPFDHNEWHLAPIEIPSEEWEAVFELISWMNSVALFVMLVLEQGGEDSGLRLARELNEQLLSVLPDSGPALAGFFHAILYAPPLPSDHSVFVRNEWCQRWSTHTAEFGRAKAALDNVTGIDKEEALSLLGPCMVYGTHCSLARFSGLIPKLRFVEKPQTMPHADEVTGMSSGSTS